MADLDEDILQELYVWVDQIDLSRPKKNIIRDFSDGVLMAEVIKHYFPQFVDLHNFQPCFSMKEKKKNWQTLNWKVFKKLNFELSNDVIDNIISNKAGTIERVLLLLRSKIDQVIYDKQQTEMDAPESEQSLYMGAKPMSNRGGPQGKNRSMKKTTSMPNVQNDVVPRLAYEERVQECLAKDETIEILQAKIRRLEHLLHLKDVRIDDLQGHMDRGRPTGMTNPENNPKRVGIPRMK